MKIRSFAGILLTACLLCTQGCDKGTAPSKEKQSAGKTALTLEAGPDKLMREPGATEPFTGVQEVPFANSTKKIEREVPYVNGLKQGTERIFLTNGKPKSEIDWEAGLSKRGRHFYSDGTLKTEFELNGVDLMLGKHRRFHRNGKLMNENTIGENGVPVGREKNYDDTGELRSEYTWENGKIVQVHFETPLARTEREKWESEAPAEDAN